MSDFYEILGVERNASMTTIKSAFKKLAKELHDKRKRYDNTINTSGNKTSGNKSKSSKTRTTPPRKDGNLTKKGTSPFWTRTKQGWKIHPYRLKNFLELYDFGQFQNRKERTSVKSFFHNDNAVLKLHNQLI